MLQMKESHDIRTLDSHQIPAYLPSLNAYL